MIARGDRFIQRVPGAEPLFIEVTRVGRAGWVDIRCCTWAVMWTKRMPNGLAPLLSLPFPIVPEAWTMEDVLASAPVVPW